jgi:hypothetical protein
MKPFLVAVAALAMSVGLATANPPAGFVAAQLCQQPVVAVASQAVVQQPLLLQQPLLAQQQLVAAPLYGVGLAGVGPYGVGFNTFGVGFGRGFGFGYGGIGFGRGFGFGFGRGFVVRGRIR